jgi:hypothetical protein
MTKRGNHNIQHDYEQTYAKPKEYVPRGKHIKYLRKRRAYLIFCVNGKVSSERNPFFSELNGKLV